MKEQAQLNKSSTLDEKQAARRSLRLAILRARTALEWNEIVRVLADCPIDDDDVSSLSNPNRRVD